MGLCIFPDILVLFCLVIGEIVMTFSNNVSYMVKILTFYIIMARIFTMHMFQPSRFQRAAPVLPFILEISRFEMILI